MKRINKILISIALVVALTSSVFSGVLASADTETTYSTVAHHHFDNLGGNIPNNVYNSCAYVAMSMLLSFYDSYWNDSFVPEDYESDIKPAVTADLTYPNRATYLVSEDISWNEISSGLSDAEAVQEYRNFILNNDDDYLHLNLLSLGISLGYHPTISNTYGISLYEEAAVLDAYFDNIFGNNDYYVADQSPSTAPIKIKVLYESSSSREEVLSIIQTNVTNGNPVIYRGVKTPSNDGNDTLLDANNSSSGTSGHAMVAYALDGNDIKLHTGHISNSYSSIQNTEYNTNIGVLWLEFDDAFSHVCCNNYYFYGQSENACSCQAYKNLHPRHVHQKSDEVISYDSSTHTYRCVWGDEMDTEPHSYTYVSQNLRYHSATCSCGYSTTILHTWQRISLSISMCTYCGQTKDHLNGKPEMVPLDNENEEEIE